MKKKWMIIFLFLMLLGTQAYAKDDEPEIVSETAIVMETETGAILYEKNANTKMYPASLTKIATAIFAIENGNLNDVVTISKEAVDVDGTKVYLEEGEQVTLKKLVQGMLINSGNDAAKAIAIHLEGNEENFSKKLNAYMRNKIKVTETHFTNPHGLFSENHYTTAKDMAIITNYAMKNETFAEVFGTVELKWDGESWDTTLISHHQLLTGQRPYEWITGGKTGFVSESKQTLAFIADNGKLALTAIVMKADFKRDIYKDTKTIFDYSFSHYENKELVPEQEYFVGEKVFQPTENSYKVSLPIEGFTEHLNNQGVLEIVDNNDKVIQEITLEREQPKQEVANHHTMNEASDDTEKENPTLIIYIAIGSVAIILIVVFLFIRKMRKRNRYDIHNRRW